MRNGVMQVEALKVQAKLDAADDLDSVMAAGWEAFEFVLAVADAYADLKTNAFAAWMGVTGPASKGSTAIEPRSRGPRQAWPEIGLGEPVRPDKEDHAFRNLARLAEQLHGKLSAAAGDPRPERVYDAEACGRAAAAALELHGLLTLDE